MSEQNNDQDNCEIPLQHEEVTFHDRQKQRVKEMEKKMQDEVRKKRKLWEKEIERMKEEFMELHEDGKKHSANDKAGSLKRHGSFEVLDITKMKTLFMDYPGQGRRFKLRFDLQPYEKDTIKVLIERDRVTVHAKKIEENDEGKKSEKSYTRKILLPVELEHKKLRSFLTSDKILTIEAPLPPHSLNLRKLSGSPSHSSHSSRSRSPSTSPHTPNPAYPLPKMGMPYFGGENGERRFNMMIDIGKVYTPKEIVVQVVKENCIEVHAKHKEHTAERQSKCKFNRVYELQEKIETLSLRAGVTEEGKLIVGALGKGHNPETKEAAQDELGAEITANAVPCNVLDLSTFPPSTPPSAV